jgi:uncharacterized protein (DUF433 family)
MNWNDHIEQRSDIMGGKPVIKGTRLTVEHILERISAGWTQSQLITSYPHLKPEHIHAAIIFDISIAFDGVSREDGTTLHEAEGLDCHFSHEELLQERKLDTDTRWQNVPDDWIGQLPSAFRFMNAKGLRYYLPAVMIWHFKHAHWSEPASADAVYGLLTDPNYPHRDLHELFASLTESQRRATARWLYFYPISSKDHPEDARRDSLRGTIWQKYLESGPRNVL